MALRNFALLASVALHDKSAANEIFADCLPLIEAAATDERNFVKKAVSWGKKRGTPRCLARRGGTFS